MRAAQFARPTHIVRGCNIRGDPQFGWWESDSPLAVSTLDRYAQVRPRLLMISYCARPRCVQCRQGGAGWRTARMPYGATREATAGRAVQRDGVRHRPCSCLWPCHRSCLGSRCVEALCQHGDAGMDLNVLVNRCMGWTGGSGPSKMSILTYESHLGRI